ncbi:hypothetical protein R5W24_003092 [Gemmata sp. JC717]|uniref:hypothetical protein n=1 Tax=Gemmata algarum TaxID=2975278 RepID=UPI0021BB7CC2|nr:hypothetical protein [Gemmata algarum]MDY3553978.1 hypothetical protein [Gemmata algarum]
MLTLDTVRAALLSEQPWPKIDALVRAELSSGHTTRQIYSSLMALANEVDATPGLSEDGSDAFGDVLDALTGYCRPECQYKDPPNVTVPNAEEMATQPRWAQVAFAARCARRVLLLPEHRRPSTPVTLILVASKAVDVAEQSAGIGYAHPEARESYASLAATNANGYGPAIDALAAVGAADEFDKRVAGYAAVAGNAAAGDAYTIANIRRVVRRDFDNLSQLAEAQRWDDDTPVPPEVFGPLWPEGAPKGWPASDVPLRPELVIEGFVREQAAHRAIVDDVVNLFHALNRYYIARSGSRLTLDQFNSLLPARVPAEV